MDAKVTRRDLELMETLAEHRVLTALMLATIRSRNVRALRRRLAALIDLGLLVADRRYQRAPRGRPERMISVSAAGVDLLKDRGILDPRAPTERATRPADRHLRHLTMMNELRAQLSQIPRMHTELSVRFLSSTSPFLPTWAQGRPITFDRFRAPEGRECSLIPDGVLALSHATLKKTLLFFVEIDTGSEPVTSPAGASRRAVAQVGYVPGVLRMRRVQAVREDLGLPATPLPSADVGWYAGPGSRYLAPAA